jgi:hypothetical protein
MKKILCFCLLILFSFAAHKYYHSHCSFELNAASGNAELVLEVFTHDVELALGKKNQKAIKIDDKEINSYLKDYLKENFILKNTEGKILDFTYVGSEVKGDEIQIYFEYPALKSFKGLVLTNSILSREFATQVNKVNLKNGEMKKSLVFTAKVLTLKLD